MDEGGFALSLDRSLHSELLLLSICPTQDIIACCFSDQISCHRLQWQRIWTHPIAKRDGSPTAIVWHPDAKLLGIGFSDGTLTLLEPERGEVCVSVKVLESRITSLSWLEDLGLAEEGILLKIGGEYWDLIVSLLKSLVQHCDDTCADLGVLKAAASVRRHTGGPWSLPSKSAKPWTVLCAGDERGRISLLSEGLTTLASFDMGSVVPSPTSKATSSICKVGAPDCAKMHVSTK
jgi:hypothetical protein